MTSESGLAHRYPALQIVPPLISIRSFHSSCFLSSLGSLPTPVFPYALALMSTQI